MLKENVVGETYILLPRVTLKSFTKPIVLYEPDAATFIAWVLPLYILHIYMESVHSMLEFVPTYVNEFGIYITK